MDTAKLKNIILSNEDFLIGKILKYAKEQNYVKYTSTLREAWRMSISGLSAALVKILENNQTIPGMGPDDDFTKSEIAEFGIIEARKHRSRGVTLSMFLGLMKYYQQAYEELIRESEIPREEKETFSCYIKRYFDHIELGFVSEWAGLSEINGLEELQAENRKMTNEKNKYLTVFESIYDPIILVGKDNNIENINFRAAEEFLDGAVPGMRYYGRINTDKEFGWLNDELGRFLDLNLNEVLQEKTIETRSGQKTFLIKFKKMLDISEKYRGTVIIFNDITERLKFEKELKIQHEKLEAYAFTDQLTGIPNRRTGLMALEKELASSGINDIPSSVCFIDLDGLKMVNDTYGHFEGDNLIILVASSIKSQIREIDSVSRMGGDEFLIIFPECTGPNAERVMKRICDKLEEYDRLGEKPYRHSFSYGIMEITKDNKLNVNEVIKIVDERMYQNKFLKRNHGNESTET